MNRILVLPSYEYYATYSGTKYLLERLCGRGYCLRVIMRMKPENRHLYGDVPYRVDAWTWWNPHWPKFLRLVSHFLMWLKIIVAGVRSDVVLVIDAYHLGEAAMIKRLKPKVKIIHYSQELQIPEEFPGFRGPILRKKYSPIVDLSIDVDPMRAKVSQEVFSLEKRPMVLLNTLPMTSIPSRGVSSLFDLAEIAPVQGRVVILYAGAVGPEKPFSRIVDAVAMVDVPHFFIAFISATEEKYSAAVEYAKNRLHATDFVVHRGVKREALLSAEGDADIGIVDYTYAQEPTLNQRFCAPTKFYEYLAAGLMIVSSENENLAEIIDANDVGEHAVDGSVESLGAALARCCRKASGDAVRAKARKVFANSLCYEKANDPVLAEIFGIIDDWANSLK